MKNPEIRNEYTQQNALNFIGMNINASEDFIEQTILTVFLWIGIWEIIALIIQQYVQGFGTKLAIYIFFVISSFYIMKSRKYT